jgi:hypothetical protein
MRLREILSEGIVVHGIELFAYTVTIAEMYDALPEFEEDAVPAWEALVQSNDKLAQRILGDIDVEYYDENPYPKFNSNTYDDIIHDVLVNHKLKVFKTPDNTHPGMSAGQNDLFRALHDVIGHIGGNSQDFFSHLLKKEAGKVSGSFMPTSSGFTVRGEMNTYITHSKMVPAIAVPALFTEIVGQISYYFTTGSYTNNKVAIMQGIDFKNIGVLNGSANERMQEIIQQMNDDSVSSIQTSIPGVTIDKSKIRWKLLSVGTGAMFA